MVAKRNCKTRKVLDRLPGDERWVIIKGELCRDGVRASGPPPLFEVVGEKIPFELLSKVRDDVRNALGRTPIKGIYLAHDSVGVARYAGRGNIFGRLYRRYSKYRDELKYFSFFVVRDKIHEREIETLCIRVAGPQLLFNTQKKREDIRAGGVRDWEVGTLFYQRRYARGSKPKK